MKILPLLMCTTWATVTAADVEQRTALNGQLVLQNIPEIPSGMAESLARYHNTRSPLFLGFTPDSKNIHIKTRFDGVNQIHRVDRPGGTRRQLTFVEEPVGEAVRQPGGNLIAFAMDKGGSGFDQIILLNPENGETDLLTDGKSLNNRMV